MNTKVQINWDDINQNEFQYFVKAVRKKRTYKEIFFINEENIENKYFGRYCLKYEGKNYFIPNPFVSLFFEKDHTIVPDFITNYKKGQKHFKKNYHKKAPDENYIERMKQLFNDEFKRILTGIEFIYNDKVGFRNGLLSAYIEFEEANYDLFELLSKNEESNNNNESRTKKVIFETFTNIDKQGWQYAFVSEQDYNLFTDLLTNFFEYKPYTLPETIIQLKRTCKTKVAKALGEIHKELSNENKLSTDTKYFQLIRVLSHFKDEPERDLYKALTR